MRKIAFLIALMCMVPVKSLAWHDSSAAIKAVTALYRNLENVQKQFCRAGSTASLPPRCVYPDGPRGQWRVGNLGTHLRQQGGHSVCPNRKRLGNLYASNRQLRSAALLYPRSGRPIHQNDRCSPIPQQLRQRNQPQLHKAVVHLITLCISVHIFFIYECR